MATSKLTIEDRFWSHVDKTGECWVWNGPNVRGYGRISFGGKTWLAHRWLYQQLNGPLPDDVHVCHHCDNPPCVNPAHLFAGTRSDNQRDSARKGRNGMQRHPHRSSFRGRRVGQFGERNGNAKLTRQDVIRIREMKMAGAKTMDVARLFGIHDSYVRHLMARRWWRDAEPARVLLARCEGDR